MTLRFTHMLALFPSALFALDHYDLASAVVKNDGHIAYQVSLKPKAPWKINLDAPLSLDLTATGARFAKLRFEKEDSKVNTGDESRFDLQGQAHSELVEIEATFRFYLCSDKGCKKFEENLKNSLRAPGSLTAKGPPSVAF